MTRFVGDAVSVRSSAKSFLTGKDHRKNMEVFRATGKHPEIEKARQKADADNVPSLPDHDPNRDHVFLDISSGSKSLGRLVIELYHDIVPVGAAHLKTRCLPGSKAGLKGALAYKLQIGYAVWLGKSSTPGECVRVPKHSRLRHVEIGAVSVSLNGDEVVISLGRSLVLDSSYQVVGRVHQGMEVLEALNDLSTTHTDAPSQKLQVTLCGSCNASGVHEELDVATGPPKDAATRLAEASASTRNAVRQALAEGLGAAVAGKKPGVQHDAAQDRKAPAQPAAAEGEEDGQQGGESASGQEADGNAGDGSSQRQGGVKRAPTAEGVSWQQQGQARSVKARYMDAMLGDVSDDSGTGTDADEPA